MTSRFNLVGIALLWLLCAPPVREARATAPSQSSNENSGEAAAGAASTPDSTARDAGEPAAVLELPEEVVHGGGLDFAPSGGLRVMFSGRQAQQSPGGFADPTRYLQTLPGVANDSDFDGLLFVRGGEGHHNQILLDQVSVNDPYHFGAVVSFLNTDVIDRMEFTPGGYAAQYGDALGGVLSVNRRIGNPFEFHGGARLTSTTINALAEGPIGGDGKGSWLVSGRRSHLDQALKGRSLGQATLPYFYDLDGRIFRQVNGHKFKLGFLRSGDEISARLSDQFTFAPPDSSGLTWERQYSLATLNWEHDPGGWHAQQAIAYSWRNQDVVLHGDLPQTAVAATRNFDWRGDLGFRSAGMDWSFGAQLSHTHTEYEVDINRLTLEDTDRRSSPRSPIDTVRTITTFEGRNLYNAAYGQVSRDFFGSSLSVLFGTRIEHTSRSNQVEPMPRLRVEWRTPVKLLVSGAAGSYRQFPGHRIETDPNVGNASLGAERARHLMLGVALPLSRGGRVSVEGYHKKLNDLIVVANSTETEGTRFYNTGSGIARGVEFLVHVPRPKWSAWASYTWADVVYQDAPGLPLYAPAQDLRHLISTVVEVRPGPGWIFGLKWRAHSGRPYTPVIGRTNVSEFVEDVQWIPVEGEFHSGRFPWYHRLDVRAERGFRLGGTQAGVFLEFINLYGRNNLFDYRYLDGYSRATPVEMMPFLPTFGISVSI